MIPAYDIARFDLEDFIQLTHVILSHVAGIPQLEGGKLLADVYYIIWNT